MEYPHQDLAQQIADYWASPDIANQKLAFAFLKSQTLDWAEKDVKELINTALCLCWNKPELLEFLDFEKRKKVLIENSDKILAASDFNVKLGLLGVGDFDNRGVEECRENLIKTEMFVGFWHFYVKFSAAYIGERERIRQQITATMVTKAAISNDNSEIDKVVAEYKDYLPVLVDKANTYMELYIGFDAPESIESFYRFDESDYPDLIDWLNLNKIAPYFTEVLYNNLDKLAE